MKKGFSFYAFGVLSWGLVACIAVQTFLAGLAVFTDPAHWSSHVSFVHWFEYVPVLMLVFAFTGRLSNTVKRQCGALFGLIFVQYATANAPGAGALHPVIALLLFWLAFQTAKGVRIRPGDAVATNGTERKAPHPLLIMLLSLLGGFLAGMLLSQLVGIVGYYVFDFPAWMGLIRYLPIVTGIGSAIIVPILLRKGRK